MRIKLPAALQQRVEAYQGQAQQWWKKREPREQQLLVVMGVLLGVLIFWYGVWQPLQHATQRAEQRVAAQQETWRHVLATTQQIERLRDTRPAQRRAEAVTGAQLNSFISNTSAQHNLEVARLQPQSDGVQVTYNEAAFDDLLAFLAVLEARQVQLEAIDVAAGDEPGIVRVRRLQVKAGL